MSHCSHPLGFLITGSVDLFQGTISPDSSGKRELNLRQVRALARRFGVAADAFL